MKLNFFIIGVQQRTRCPLKEDFCLFVVVFEIAVVVVTVVVVAVVVAVDVVLAVVVAAAAVAAAAAISNGSQCWLKNYSYT